MVRRWRVRLAGSAVIIAVAGFVLRDLFLEELMYVISEKVVTFGSGQDQYVFATSAVSSVLDCAPEMDTSGSVLEQVLPNVILVEVLPRPTLEQVLSKRACGGLKIVVFDAARLPFVTKNISDAWREGRPAVLTSESGAESGNRGEVCPMTFPRAYSGSCAAYPFASAGEGGSGARAREVPAREGRCQAATLTAQRAAAGINDGDSYIVVITHPDLIAAGPYLGVDIASDQSCG